MASAKPSHSTQAPGFSPEDTQMNNKLTLIAVLLLSATSLLAQTGPPVPVPSQIASAHTAFLASGGAPGAGRNENLMTGLTYTGVYQALAKAGHYQLTATPADAELSMTIAIHDHLGSVSQGTSFDDFFLRLEISDTKTHALLWAIDEPIQGAFREKTFQKNLDASITLLITDLNLLAAGNIPGDPAPASTKTRFSQDN
jgi:hypothetical protein